MSELESPEFWAAVGFCLIVIAGAKPVFQKLKVWSQSQAETVQKELGEAHTLRKEAEDLYARYEEHTRHLDKEKAAILQAAEKEVLSLQQDADEALSNRLAHKQQDVQERIALIQENAHKDLVDKMLQQVISKTKDLLSEKEIRQTSADMDIALDQVLKTLEQSKSLLSLKS